MVKRWIQTQQQADTAISDSISAMRETQLRSGLVWNEYGFMGPLGQLNQIVQQTA